MIGTRLSVDVRELWVGLDVPWLGSLEPEESRNVENLPSVEQKNEDH